MKNEKKKQLLMYFYLQPNYSENIFYESFIELINKIMIWFPYCMDITECYPWASLGVK